MGGCMRGSRSLYVGHEFEKNEGASMYQVEGNFARKEQKSWT
jgi:hypothetical protein